MVILKNLRIITIFAKLLVHKLLTAATVEVTKVNLYQFNCLYKGYFRYQTITSQNVLSEAQIKNFLFYRKLMFHSQDIQFFVFLTFNHPMIYQICDIMMSIVNETGLILEYIF